MHKYNFIVIEGNIGAGKTTLSKMLAQEFKAKLVLENFANNPFLPKFYEDPNKYAFQLETSFLIDRYDQLKKYLQAPDLFSEMIISDYYFSKSLIFAKITLKDDEFNLYRKLFWLIYKSVPKPDLYVYLHLNIDRLLKNIKKRGRPYEQSIKPEYLEAIQNSYFDFFKEQKDLKFLIIDTNNIDFVENPYHYELLKKNIFENEYSQGVNTILM